MELRENMVYLFQNTKHMFSQHIILTCSVPSIFSLSSLVSLELRENMLRQLPASMSFLIKLEILDLGSNEMDDLVSCQTEIVFLQKLMLLHVSHKSSENCVT